MVSSDALAQWISHAKHQATLAGIDLIEVDWLVKNLTDLSSLDLRLGLYRHQPQINCLITIEDLYALWERRVNEQIPVQYLVGFCHWRDLVLQVSDAVLIPRPETELLIDVVINAVQLYPFLADGHWVDLGTGSGAIAIALAKVLPNAMVHGVDLSQSALAIAQTNATKLGVSVKFHQGAWWNPLSELQGKISGMISNPPYIPTGEIISLSSEVQHEPLLALDGGIDGLDAIRFLVKTAPDYLISGGIWLIEMMQGQAQSVVQLLTDHGCYEDNIQVLVDLAGIERFVLAYRK